MVLKVGEGENIAAEIKLIERAIRQGYDQVKADCLPASVNLVWTSQPQSRFNSDELAVNLAAQRPNSQGVMGKLTAVKSHPNTKVAVVHLGDVGETGNIEHLYAVIDFEHS